MKNVFKITLALTLVVMMAAGCQQKTSTNKKKSSSSSSNGLTGEGTDVIADSGTIDDCDGVRWNYDATRCYYKNINRITLSGAGNPNQTGASAVVIGNPLWTSSNNLPGYDQSSFESDTKFRIRIKALAPLQNDRSVAGKSCTGNLSAFTRMKVFFMLRNSSNPIMPYVEVEAKINQYSQKISIDVPKGTGNKVLEVVGILTDHRCQRENPPTGCSNGTYWGDIPLVVSSKYPDAPTGCASFKVEYATDTTYDLPN